MKRRVSVFFLFAVLLVLSGCLPAASPTPEEAGEPTADLQGTAQALAEIMVMQTLESLPTPTLVLPTETPTLEPIILPETPTPNLLPLLTDLPTTSVTPSTTPKSSAAAWSCDKIPDFVERGILNIENDTHKSIYISLFGLSRPHEYHVCYEFPLRHSTSLEIPLGSYTYVVVVGGAKFKGTFDYKTTNKIAMTVYKDRVAIH